ncbi:MAG: 50S ribosomal protein L17 [Candidatus Omnitrophica bacterium]|nr:50S ribosomal protein L17 [Candidatus Omnitrophota bacterium]
MRHQNRRSKLNRSSAHRKSMFMNMANSLLKHQRIETTKAKAKGLKNYIEPIINTAKNNPDSIAAMRRVNSKLCNKDIVKLLFKEIAPLYAGINGGYTRIIHAGVRKGDAADLVIMELTKKTKTDAELLKIVVVEEKKPKKKKKVSASTSKDKDAVVEVSADEVKEVKEVKEAKKAKVEKKKPAQKDTKLPKQQGFLKRFRRQAGDK